MNFQNVYVQYRERAYKENIELCEIFNFSYFLDESGEKKIKAINSRTHIYVGVEVGNAVLLSV